MFKDKGLEKDLLEHFKHLKFVALDVCCYGSSKFAEKSLSETRTNVGENLPYWMEYS